MPAAIAIPLIAAAVTTGGTVAAGKMAADSANNMTAATNKSVANSQGYASQLGQSGQNLLQTGLPMFQQGAGYYGSLLNSRNAAQAATAPAAANITGAFTGAKTGVQRSFLQGGQRDQALADLNRDQANQVSRLYAGVQPAAASALMQGGANAIGQGNQAFGAAAGASTQAGQLGLGQAQFSANQQQMFGSGFGNLLGGLPWQQILGGFGKTGASNPSAAQRPTMGIPSYGMLPPSSFQSGAN